MSDWIALAIYLLVSIATYVGLLRVASRPYGVDWFLVLWSLFAFVPVIGQIVLAFVWAVEHDWNGGPAIPRWLRRLAGDKA